MKKLLLSAMLFTSLLMAPTQKSEAVVGGVVALAGGPAAIAYVGLTMMVGGPLIAVSADAFGVNLSNDDGMLLALGGIFYGLIILDGEYQLESELPTFSHGELLDKGLTEAQALGYEENSAELSSVFNAAMNVETKEESKAIWADAQDVYGVDALNGLREVLKTK